MEKVDATWKRKNKRQFLKPGCKIAAGLSLLQSWFSFQHHPWSYPTLQVHWGVQKVSGSANNRARYWASPCGSQCCPNSRQCSQPYLDHVFETPNRPYWSEIQKWDICSTVEDGQCGVLKTWSGYGWLHCRLFGQHWLLHGDAQYWVWLFAEPDTLWTSQWIWEVGRLGGSEGIRFCKYPGSVLSVTLRESMLSK